MGTPMLRVIVDHEVVEEHALDGPVTLGRLEDNTVVLSDARVSGHHGRIAREAGVWRYTDVGSTNGSLVAAGSRLRKGESLVLTELTQIMLGRCVIEFRPTEEPATAQRSQLVLDTEPPPEKRPSVVATTAPIVHRLARATSEAPPDAASDPPSGQADAGAGLAVAGAADALRDGQGPTCETGAVSGGVAPQGPTGTDPVQPGGEQDPIGMADLVERTRPRLLVVIGGESRTLPIKTASVTIGRATRSDIVLDHGSVSAHHAELVCRDGRWNVRDLDSTNGTRLNLALLEGERGVRNGSHLILGSVDVLFFHDVPEEAPELAPDAFLDWLLERRQITRSQRKWVDAELAAGLRQVDEILVTSGVLPPGALEELRHNATLRVAARQEAGGRTAGNGALWVGVAIAAAVVGAAALAWWLL